MSSTIQTSNIVSFASCAKQSLSVETESAETPVLLQLYSDVQNEISRLTQFRMERSPRENDPHEAAVIEALAACTRNVDIQLKQRLIDEFTGVGPLDLWMSQEDITEILIQGTSGIYVERNGRLLNTGTRFLGETTLNRVLHKILEEAGAQISQAHPFANGRWGEFRVHVITPPVTEFTTISLRRRRDTKWSLDSLLESGWAHREEIEFLRDCLQKQRHIMVVGPTGAGKTSVLEALLNELSSTERCILIEDTPEIRLPNRVSCRLLTRQDPQDLLPEVTATELVRQALRMRPDRLLLGEIRGAEARDFLLAVSTGHSGGLSTIHANNPQTALSRLEMLVQMAAPEWSPTTVRRLIRDAIDFLVICTKDPAGRRKLAGLHRISSLEESGFTLESIELVPIGQ